MIDCRDVDREIAAAARVAPALRHHHERHAVRAARYGENGGAEPLERTIAERYEVRVAQT
jgi:hypothetical protein